MRPFTVMVVGEFQSTHPLRGATSFGQSLRAALRISIHAPLAGCDEPIVTHWMPLPISIHAPLAGCDALTKYYTKV